jgi:LPS export ABC transporter protein LptC
VKYYLLLILIIFPIVLSSCEGDEVKPSTVPVTLSKEVPSQTSTNSRMTFSQDGAVKAVLNAGLVRIYESRRATYLDSNVKVNFFDRDGHHSSLLTSRRAVINDNTKDMTAYDSVKVKSDSGVFVETDSMVWSNTTRLIHSDAFVRITEKNGRITTGMGFESDQDFLSYQILRPTIITSAEDLKQLNSTPSFNSNSTFTPALTEPPVSVPMQPKDTKDSSR